MSAPYISAPVYVSPTGDFARDQSYIATRITGDGCDGYPVEAGRYRLTVSRACPWANRTIIVRRLLGLEEPPLVGIAGPTHDAQLHLRSRPPAVAILYFG